MTQKFTDENIWIVMPAFNESPEIIRTVLGKLKAFTYKVVVVDDGSRRPVADSISEFDVFLCEHAVNLGQGAAIATGIEFALAQGAKYIVTFDSDNQHDCEEISSILAPICDGRADVSLGSRFLGDGFIGNVSRKKWLILKLAVMFTRFSTGLNLTDTHNGFRGFSRYAAGKMRITQNRMAHASEILNLIASEKLKYSEVPVTITYSGYSVSKGQKISNAFNVIWDLCVSKLENM